MEVPDHLSPSTRKAYDNALARWHGWCEERGVAALPATHETLKDYLVYLWEENVGAPMVETTIAAVHDAHRAAGHPSPTDHPDVRVAAAAFGRP